MPRSDGGGGSDTGKVSFTVTAVNDAPTVTSPVAVNTNEDTALVGQVTATLPSVPAAASAWSGVPRGFGGANRASNGLVGGGIATVTLRCWNRSVTCGSFA